MTSAARTIAVTIVMGLLVGLASFPAAAQPTNKPSNPEAEAKLVLLWETWSSRDPASCERAIKALESLRTQYPDTLEADLAFVRTLMIRRAIGDKETVQPDYEQWLATEPSPIAQGHALEIIADDAIKSGDLAEAERLYKEAIALCGKHAMAGRAATNLAKMYLRSDRASQAFALYEQTADDFAGTPFEAQARRRWAKAIREYAAVDSPEVLEQMRAVLAPTLEMSVKSPWVAHARLVLAVILRGLSRPAEALAACEAAAANIRLYRDATWAPGCLATLMSAQRTAKQLGAAIATGERYVELFADRGGARVLKIVVNLQRESERFDDAIASARRYIEVFPDDAAWAQLSIGLTHAAKRDFARAVEEFDKVLTLYGTHPDAKSHCAMALLQKGWAEQTLGRTREARATLERLVREYPDDPAVEQAQYELGLMETQ